MSNLMCSEEMYEVLKKLNIIKMLMCLDGQPAKPGGNQAANGDTTRRLRLDNGIFTMHLLRKHIRQILSDNIDGKKFIRAVRRKESDRFCLYATKVAVIDSATSKSTESDMEVIFNCAKMVRKDILVKLPWQFVKLKIADLKWVIDHIKKFNGSHSVHPDVDLSIESDASLFGWGAFCNGKETGGAWTSEEASYHITYLETFAAFFALLNALRVMPEASIFS
ncbi:hypothetical protein AC249_AIPGENE28449 [Exaiptasia diaphana]|nr:hypothetical protein AC249_AIPGENE28449 [Exaiptasia diaphana]